MRLKVNTCNELNGICLSIHMYVCMFVLLYPKFFVCCCCCRRRGRNAVVLNLYDTNGSHCQKITIIAIAAITIIIIIITKQQQQIYNNTTDSNITFKWKAKRKKPTKGCLRVQRRSGVPFALALSIRSFFNATSYEEFSFFFIFCVIFPLACSLSIYISGNVRSKNNNSSKGRQNTDSPWSKGLLTGAHYSTYRPTNRPIEGIQSQQMPLAATAHALCIIMRSSVVHSTQFRALLQGLLNVINRTARCSRRRDAREASRRSKE